MTPTYFCNKCGYFGQQGGTHPKPKGSGQLCHYQPVPTKELTPEERKAVVERFSLQDTNKWKSE